MKIRINKYIRANSFFVNSFFSREMEKKILIVTSEKLYSLLISLYSIVINHRY